MGNVYSYIGANFENGLTSNFTKIDKRIDAMILDVKQKYYDSNELDKHIHYNKLRQKLIFIKERLHRVYFNQHTSYESKSKTIEEIEQELNTLS